MTNLQCIEFLKKKLYLYQEMPFRIPILFDSPWLRRSAERAFEIRARCVLCLNSRGSTPARKKKSSIFDVTTRRGNRLCSFSSESKLPSKLTRHEHSNRQTNELLFDFHSNCSSRSNS